MNQRNLHRIGATVLVVFAFVIALMGKPPHLTPIRSIEELGAISAYGEDRVQPLTLAEWVMARTGDYQIVDLRSPQDFEEYHIEGAVNIPFTSLFTDEGLERMADYEKIVLVCTDGSRSAQAWTWLRSQGYEVYILEGGIKGWFRQIMTPVSAQDQDLTDIDPHEFAAKLKAIREHFTGSADDPGISSQTDTAPPPPPPTTAPKRHKKKSGGC